MLDCEVTGSIMYLVSSSLPPSTHPHIHRGDVAALFKHHSAPITSVEWHPHDSTVFASAGADDQVELICVTVLSRPSHLRVAVTTYMVIVARFMFRACSSGTLITCS